MTAKFKVGQWISKEDVLKLGKVRWNVFRDKYKSEHTTTAGFIVCGRFEGYSPDGDSNVFVYKDGDLVWDDSIGRCDQQIAYETVIEYLGEKEMNKFDLKTQPWWIRVNNEEESKAAQLWLFEQGMTWRVGDTNIRIGHIYRYLMNISSVGVIDKDGFMHSSRMCDGMLPEYEIKLSFKTTTKVVDAIYPEADELVELNGKKYKKSDLEAALSKLTPVGE